LQILILGAGGFIGANLAEHLLKKSDHEIIGVDTEGDKVRELVDEPRFTLIRCDISRDSHVVEDLVKSADVVLDLIAYANPSVYVSRPLEVVDLNFFQNLKLVEKCIHYEKRLIQFSTCEVYGRANGRREPFNEDKTPLVMGPIKNQRWIYASAKELLERVIYAHGQEGELEFTIIRPFNFVGPKIDYLVEAGSIGGPRVFSHFMSALIGNGPLRLVDGGNAHRSYTHIDDAARAIQLVIENPDRCRNEIINIGNANNGTTIRALAHLMLELYEELTGKRPEAWIEDIRGEEFYGVGYEDCDWRIPDVTKVKSLGWEPTLDLRETFKRTMAWHLERLADDSALPSFLQPARVLT
jgi:UDP-apiose/xylose synthase